MMSVVPPAVNATTIFTGFVGYCWAAADETPSAAVRTSNKRFPDTIHFSP